MTEKPHMLAKKAPNARWKRALVSALVILTFGSPSRLLAEVPNDVPLVAADEPELGAWNYVLPFGIAMFQNLVFWGFSNVVTQTSFAAVNWETIKRNFRVGFEWDVDSFSTNQFGHPYQGGLYFAAARASKLGFWTSTLYAAVGSLQWEMFMETELPSYNDLVTTTFGGAIAGEVLYRLSSAVLDPSTSGAERFGREIAATLISPTAGLTRLINGEIVEDGPSPMASDINLDLIVGPDRLREDGSNFKLPSLSLGIEIEYGDLAPKSDFEPFDWFKVSASVNLNNRALQRGAVDAMGLLTRHGFGCGPGSCLIGINQHYSYLDTPIFQVGTSSFGGLFRARFDLSDSFSLTAGAQLNLIALGGMNSLYPLAEAYDLGTGIFARNALVLRYETRNQDWFREFELALSNTRYFVRVLRGVDGNEYAGVSRFHMHTSIFDGFGIILGADLYDRQTLPDELPNISSSYYTEQLFLVWKI
jgi:hypothetical protein